MSGNALFSILVSGLLVDYFKNSGLKHGGPLSHFLFFVVVEAFGVSLS